MSTIQIYHNPRCSKSREALALLQARGVTPEVVDYMQQGLTRKAVEDVLARLGCGARAVLRTSEAAYKEQGLGDASLSEAALVDAIVAEPRLLQRPVVVRGERAVIARPAELLLELLD